MKPRIANCENDNDDNDDNVDDDFVTVSGAADDNLSDLTTLQSEKTSFILTPKTYLSLGTLKVRTLDKPGKKGTSPKRDEPLPLGHRWTI